MAAHGDATVTIDTDEMVYTDRHGLTHTVNNTETFILDLKAASTGENYQSLSGEQLTCEDSYQIIIEKDPTFTQFAVAADATAETGVGSITFREEDGYRAEWSIRTATIDDVDEPTAITSMVLERRDNPMITMTLTTVTVAQ